MYGHGSIMHDVSEPTFPHDARLLLLSEPLCHWISTRPAPVQRVLRGGVDERFGDDAKAGFGERFGDERFGVDEQNLLLSFEDSTNRWAGSDMMMSGMPWRDRVEHKWLAPPSPPQ